MVTALAVHPCLRCSRIPGGEKLLPRAPFLWMNFSYERVCPGALCQSQQEHPSPGRAAESCLTFGGDISAI